MPKFLTTGPKRAPVRFLCAHGAGGGMESPFLDTVAELLGERGIAVWRFEFAYMAARRDGGSRKPPPKAERLMDEYRAAVAELPRGGAVMIGGKSMGGRVASMVADELFGQGRIAGLVCLGYPFHPPKAPEKLRTAHLEAIGLPGADRAGRARPVRHARRGGGVSAVVGDPAALGGRRRSRSGPARGIGLHAQGQPDGRRRCDRGVCG